MLKLLHPLSACSLDTSPRCTLDNVPERAPRTYSVTDESSIGQPEAVLTRPGFAFSSRSLRTPKHWKKTLIDSRGLATMKNSDVVGILTVSVQFS